MLDLDIKDLTNALITPSPDVNNIQPPPFPVLELFLLRLAERIFVKVHIIVLEKLVITTPSECIETTCEEIADSAGARLSSLSGRHTMSCSEVDILETWACCLQLTALFNPCPAPQLMNLALKSTDLPFKLLAFDLLLKLVTRILHFFEFMLESLDLGFSTRPLAALAHCLLCCSLKIALEVLELALSLACRSLSTRKFILESGNLLLLR
ncbi:hypothetical protein HG531_007639 [Fusarium graminearum]|nr:hypothetical protein HG531_007639 [Fusarium graminearum]